MRCWLLAVGPTYSSRILANAAALNTTQQMVTNLRLCATEQMHPNTLVVDIRTVYECVLPIFALLLSTTGGIAGTTTDALGSATFTAASANPVAPAYRCSAVNGRVGYCGHLRPALTACASLSWAHGSTGLLKRDSAQICAESWILSIPKKSTSWWAHKKEEYSHPTNTKTGGKALKMLEKLCANYKIYLCG